MKKIWKTIKGIITISVGFIVPIKALTEPDDTRFRCSLKGVTSSDGYTESWHDIFADFKQYVKGEV